MSRTNKGLLPPAELFDVLSSDYEAAFGGNAETVKNVQRLIKTLPPRAKVLEVGCGTGRPVCQLLVAAGFEVHGIDISPGMIELARRNVLGATFTTTDMAEYTPPMAFDAVLSMFSLFELQYSTVRSLVFKFAEWLSPGGLFLLAWTPGETLHEDLSAFDPEWEYLNDVDTSFMGQRALHVSITTSGWQKLIRSAGLELLYTEYGYFQVKVQPPLTEKHLFVTACGGERHPLLGPYPLPEAYRGPHALDREARGNFVSCMGEHDALPVPTLQGGIICMDNVSSREAQQVLEVNEAVPPNSGPTQNGDHAPSDARDEGVTRWLRRPDLKRPIVVARHVLEYAADPTSLIRNLADSVRDVGLNPNAGLMIVQSGPCSAVTKLLNDYCVPLSTTSTRRPDHQGWLLHTASQILRAAGFQSIELARVGAPLRFAGCASAEVAAAKAAELLSGLWYQKDPARGEMTTRLRQELEGIFRKQTSGPEPPFEFLIGHDEVVLTALR